MNGTIKRNEFLDILKGIAIILVVVGHCIQYGSGYNYMTNSLYFSNFAFKLIYSFHMPLFMLISGYLFYYSIKKYSFKSNLINRLKTTIVPIVSYTLICYILNKSLDFDVEIFLNNMFSNLWYLWAVFWCSVIVLIVERVRKIKNIIYVLIYFIMFFVPNIYNFHLYCFMYVFFILGFLFNKYNLKQYFKYRLRSVSIISIIIFIILFVFYDINSYIYVSGYNIMNENGFTQIFINIYRSIIGLFGSVFLISTTKMILLKTNLKFKILSYIGKNSLAIYIISSLIFVYLFPRFNVYIDNLNYIIIFMETIFVIILSLLLNFIIKKSKLLNFLILGSR